MTKEQEAGVRESLAGMDMDPAWIEEAVARCRALRTDEDITITIADTISVRIAGQLVAARELNREADIRERNQRAKDAAYEMAMDGMNKLDEDPIVH